MGKVFAFLFVFLAFSTLNTKEVFALDLGLELESEEHQEMLDESFRITKTFEMRWSDPRVMDYESFSRDIVKTITLISAVLGSLWLSKEVFNA